MKINVLAYRTVQYSKKDIRLFVDLRVHSTKSEVWETSCVVQLVPIAYFQGKVTDEAYGLLFLSAIVYAIDRSVSRHKYSIDGWSREFDVEILLPKHKIFQENKNQIDKMLSFLTGDYWNCQFVDEGVIRYPKFKMTTFYDGITQVNLFSGGLDSLIGAIDYLERNPEGHLYLSSHYDKFMSGPKTDQKRVYRALKEKYANHALRYGSPIMISPSESIETSCRSRSFIFLSLATIVAEYAGCSVAVPENGSVSLNYPLSPSRRASCSTRTTHPLFIMRFQDLIKQLGLKPKVFNPYEFYTKGEMVQNCANKSFLLDILPLSNSCGKRSMHQQMYDHRNATHCAHCMPCMYRKAALVGESDKTTYGNSLERIFNKRKWAVSKDFFAMLNFLKTPLSKEDIRKELSIAGMGSFPNIEKYVELVIRTRSELSKMLHSENSNMINKYMDWI